MTSAPHMEITMPEVRSEFHKIDGNTETFSGVVGCVIANAVVALSQAIDAVVARHGHESGRELDCHHQALAMTILSGVFAELSVKYEIPPDVISQVLDDTETRIEQFRFTTHQQVNNG